MLAHKKNFVYHSLLTVSLQHWKVLPASFPVSLILPHEASASGSSTMRDPGNEVEVLLGSGEQ